MHDEKYLQWFKRRGLDQPEHFSHDVADTPESPLSDKLERAKVSKWWLEGNVLHAETNIGHLAQVIPTNYICHGTDDRGLPILKKIG